MRRMLCTQLLIFLRHNQQADDTDYAELTLDLSLDGETLCSTSNAGDVERTFRDGAAAGDED
jgi:hypothetical protein